MLLENKLPVNKLAVHVAVNAARLPLILEKRVGYWGENGYAIITSGK